MSVAVAAKIRRGKVQSPSQCEQEQPQGLEISGNTATSDGLSTQTQREKRESFDVDETGQFALPQSTETIAPTVDTTDSVVVSHGANQVNACRDATRHAEIVAIDRMLTMSVSTDQLRLKSAMEWDDSWDQYVTSSDHGSYGWTSNPSDVCFTAEDLKHCTVYVTCEPCIMCAAALASVQVCRVVFGCANDKFGGCGSILSLHQSKPASRTNGSKNDVETTHDSTVGFAVTSGILKDEAIQLLRSFYKGENHHAPKDRRRRKQGHEIDAA